MIKNFLKLFGLSFMLMVGSFRAASAFEFESIDGGVLNLEDFKGKPVLIVNTASRCGFTYQYEGLQKLHDKYAEKGLVLSLCLLTISTKNLKQTQQFRISVK